MAGFRAKWDRFWAWLGRVDDIRGRLGVLKWLLLTIGGVVILLALFLLPRIGPSAFALLVVGALAIGLGTVGLWREHEAHRSLTVEAATAKDGPAQNPDEADYVAYAPFAIFGKGRRLRLIVQSRFDDTTPVGYFCVVTVPSRPAVPIESKIGAPSRTKPGAVELWYPDDFVTNQTEAESGLWRVEWRRPRQDEYGRSRGYGLLTEPYAFVLRGDQGYAEALYHAHEEGWQAGHLVGNRPLPFLADADHAAFLYLKPPGADTHSPLSVGCEVRQARTHPWKAVAGSPLPPATPSLWNDEFKQYVAFFLREFPEAPPADQLGNGLYEARWFESAVGRRPLATSYFRIRDGHLE